MKAWFNGKFVNREEVLVSPLSHAFSRGSAIFEVIDVIVTAKGTALFGIGEHIDRLMNSARLMRIELPASKQEIIQACVDSVRENRMGNGILKLFAYYPGAELLIVPRDPRVDISIFCFDFDSLGIDMREIVKPVDVGISSWKKYHPDTVPIQAKVTGNYVNPYCAEMEIKSRGYDDVIMIDLNGNVAEGATFSAFFVKDGKIRVPQLGNVLSGITRMAVIEVARDSGIEVDVADIPARELQGFDEAFYSGTLVHVQAIRSIERVAVGTECPGPVTRTLIDAMADVYAGRNKKFEKWLTRC